MKKIIYLLILNSLCFFHLNTQAAPCETGFLEKLKQLIFNRSKPKPYLSEQVSEKILLSELRNPELSIQSIVSPATYGQFYGDGIIPSTKFLFETPNKQATYSAFHVPRRQLRSLGQKVESGHFFLLVTIVLDAKKGLTYKHWIHWPSEAKNAYLSEDTIRDIFNAIYRIVYGERLDWMITSDVFSKTVSHIYTRDTLGQFEVYDIFNFQSLLFKEEKHQLKHTIAEVIRPSYSRQAETPQEQTTSLIPSNKMSFGMRQVILSSYSMEKLKTLPAAEIRRLPFQDIVELFNTTEKIQTVDMSLLPPEVQVQLLTEKSLWRESITPDQVRQLDTSASASGIQHVIVPTAKYYVRRPPEEITRISIDTLTDAQIEKMDRDTFLRDPFLAGELYIQGVLPMEAAMFILNRKKEIQEQGRSVVMKKSLPKKMHDRIVQHLEFETPFESMTVEQKRELFKAEAEMMLNTHQQLTILEALTQENKRGNHSWFQ